MELVSKPGFLEEVAPKGPNAARAHPARNLRQLDSLARWPLSAFPRRLYKQKPKGAQSQRTQRLSSGYLTRRTPLVVQLEVATHMQQRQHVQNPVPVIVVRNTCRPDLIDEGLAARCRQTKAQEGITVG